MRSFFYFFSALSLFFLACTDPKIKSQQLFQKALIKYNNGDIKNAIRELKKSTDLDYGNVIARKTLAQLVLERSRDSQQKSQTIDTSELVAVLPLLDDYENDTIIKIKDSLSVF